MQAMVSQIIPSLVVASGGALGAMSRYWVREFLPSVTASEFPFSTLLVNVVGCFLSGFVYMWLESSGNHWSADKLLFFFVGFLGAFTTFSAFALDSFLLYHQQQLFKLMINIGGNYILCLMAIFIGASLGARLGAQ